VLVDGRHASSSLNIRSCRGEDCDSDTIWFKLNIDREYQGIKIYMVQDKGSMSLDNKG
jgi:hypothetical protein